MDKRPKKPIQLHLELRLDYLKNIDACCESPAFYESMSQALMREYTQPSNPYPVWNDLGGMR